MTARAFVQSSRTGQTRAAYVFVVLPAMTLIGKLGYVTALSPCEGSPRSELHCSTPGPDQWRRAMATAT